MAKVPLKHEVTCILASANDSSSGGSASKARLMPVQNIV